MNIPPRGIRTIALAVAVAALGLAVAHARAGEPALTLEARFAAGGFLRGRRAAAVEVEIANAGDAFRGELQLRAEGGARFFLPVQASSGSRLRYFLPFWPGPPGPFAAWVDLVDETGADAAASRKIQSPISAQLFAAGYVSAKGSKTLQQLFGSAELRTLNTLVRIPPDRFPDPWEALDPFDVLFVKGSDFRALTASQERALHDWVLRGGGLFAVEDGVASGWKGSFAAAALGMEFGSQVEEADSPALARYAGRRRGPGAFFRIQAACRRGETIVFQGSGLLKDLVAAAPMGRGSVTVLAFDPFDPGFEAWDGARAFWNRLLADRLAFGPFREGEPSRSGAETAIEKSLHTDRNPLPSVGLVLLAVLAYAAAIGPLEYLLVRRLRRPHATVVTFPLVVALATVAALWASAGVKGRTVAQTEVTVEDVDPRTGDGVRDTYVALFSPRPAVVPLAPTRRSFTHEFGLFRSSLVPGQELPCAFGPDGFVEPSMPVGGTRYFRAAGVEPRVAPPLEVRVHMVDHLRGGSGAPAERDFEVTVVNGFETELERCEVLAGEFHVLGPRALLLEGSVGPGETRVFKSAHGDLRAVPLGKRLREVKENANPSLRDVFVHLGFLRVGWEGEEAGLLRRGLFLGEALHRDGQVFFTAWAKDEPLLLQGEDWPPARSRSLRWIRMRVTESTTFEQVEGD